MIINAIEEVLAAIASPDITPRAKVFNNVIFLKTIIENKQIKIPARVIRLSVTAKCATCIEPTVNVYKIMVNKAVFLSEIFLARKYKGIIVRVEKRAEKNLPITSIFPQLLTQEVLLVTKTSKSLVNL